MFGLKYHVSEVVSLRRSTIVMPGLARSTKKKKKGYTSIQVQTAAMASIPTNKTISGATGLLAFA